MAPSLTRALFLFSCFHSVVATPKSGLGQVSNIQPDLDFPDVSSMGLQRHAWVRKAVTSDLLDVDSADTDFADSTLLGLQQSANLKGQRKSTADEDMHSTSLLGLQRSAKVLNPPVRVSSRVSTARRSREVNMRCANVARS